MKFFFAFALLCGIALAQDNEMPEGEMQMSEEDVFLLHLMPILGALKKKAKEEMKENMEDMEPRPKLECLIKGAECFGMESSFGMKAKAAKEACMADAMMGEGMGMGEGDGEGQGEGDMQGQGTEEEMVKMEMMLEKLNEKIQSGDMELKCVLKKLHHIKKFKCFKAKMCAMKCFLGKMEWFNEETMELNREAIAADLASTKIADQVSTVSATCEEKSMMITEECLEEIVMNMKEGMEGEGDMEGEAAMSRAKKGKKKGKKGKKNKKPKKNNNNNNNNQPEEEEDMFQMPELTAEQQEKMLGAVRDTVYVGCVLHSVDDACYQHVAAPYMEGEGMPM